MLCCFAIPFLALWAVVFTRGMRFLLWCAPAAVANWADANGLRIEQQRVAVLGGPFRFRGGLFPRVVYRITARDGDWHVHEGWLLVGHPAWRALSVETCSIDVEWIS